MDIVITREALNSYLNLLHGHYISRSTYETFLRPDILLLHDYPDPVEFDRSRFWSPAKGRRGRIQNGFKMKWHNIGPGRVQLRLPVAVIDDTAYLSEAYVKDSRKKELRELARFDVHIERIRRGNYTEEGRL